MSDKPIKRKRVGLIEILLLLFGMGVAISPEIGEMARLGEVIVPSHLSKFLSGICGAGIAWCSRFVTPR